MRDKYNNYKQLKKDVAKAMNLNSVPRDKLVILKEAMETQIINNASLEGEDGNE